MSTFNTVYIYTDGSCRNKDGLHGGYGIVLKYGLHEKQIIGGQYINTTSARMELRGCINALQAITNKEFKVKLYCDNIYCIKSHSDGWMLNWEIQDWVGRKNADLLKQLLHEIRQFPEGYVQFIHVKGHQKGDTEEIKYNNICDKLAEKGGKSSVLIDDSHENH